MATFELSVLPRSGAIWPLVATVFRDDDLPVRREGELDIDPVELRRHVAEAGYGDLLGQAVFQGAVRDLFVTALRSESGLTVEVQIEAAELRTIQWQRLNAPVDGIWKTIATDQRTPFSIRLDSRSDFYFAPVQRADLQALLMVAEPSDLMGSLKRFGARTLVESLVPRLAPVRCETIGLSAGADVPASLDAAIERLVAETFSIVHIVAHGVHNRRGDDTVLHLEAADGATRLTSGTELIGAFSRLRQRPRLVFLCSCETATIAESESLSSLAHRLVIEVGIPAVIAMTDRVTVHTAVNFAETFYAQVVAHGRIDVAVAAAMARLAERRDVTVPVLFSRVSERPLFVDQPDAPLSEREIREGVRVLDAVAAERAPVLAPSVAEARATVEALGAGRGAVGDDQNTELAQVLDSLERLARSVAETSFVALARGAQLRPLDLRCPFLGLYAFTTDDHDYFYGREALIERLDDRLDETGFVPVLGPSGSGKSSLVLAGLVPRRRHRRKGGRSQVVRLGTEPVAALRDARASVGASGLVIIDQFEELFTHVRASLVEQTIAEVLDSGGPVVLTMRADFWGDCARHRELAARMQRTQELVGPMTLRELRTAVEEQANCVGLRFDPGLLQLMMEDVEGEPGAMPVLQHTLLQLWNRRHGRWLKVVEYQAIGGAAHAITATAEEVIGRMGLREQQLVRAIFVGLTALSEERSPEGHYRDTRRRVLLDDLVPVGESRDNVVELIKRLADARLLVTSSDRSDAVFVEVAHEALVQHWPTLRDWLDEDRTDLRRREDLHRAVAEWQRNDSDAVLLTHRGVRLREIEELTRHPRVRLSWLELKYIDACRSKDAEERRLAVTFEADLTRSRLRIAVRRTGKQRNVRDQLLPLPADDSVRFTSAVEMDRFLLAGFGDDAVKCGHALLTYLFTDPEMKQFLQRALTSAQRVHWLLDSDDDVLWPLPWEASLAASDEINEDPIRSRGSSRRLAGIEVPLPSRRRVPLRCAVVTVTSVEQQLSGLDVLIAMAHLDVLIAMAHTERLVEAIQVRVDVQLVSATTIDQSNPSATPVPVIVLSQHDRSGPVPDTPVSDAINATGARLVAERRAAAVVCLPPGMEIARRDRFVVAMLAGLAAGDIEDAVVAARHSLRDGADWWKPQLITGADGDLVWYQAGLGSTHATTRSVLRAAVAECKLTPIIGRSSVDSFVGSDGVVARAVAERYRFPGRDATRLELAAVLQYISAKYARNVAVDAYLDEVTFLVRGEYHHGPSPRGDFRGLESLDESLHDEALVELARLPLSCYITTRWDNALCRELERQGRRPTSEVLGLSRRQLVNDTAAEFTYPSRERPLVYHLFGRIDDPTSLVLTERDHTDFLVRVLSEPEVVPIFLRRMLADSSLCFLGFDVLARDFRDIFTAVVQQPRSFRLRSRAHVFQSILQRDESVRLHLEQYFGNLSFELYSGTMDDFLHDLASWTSID